MPSHDRRRADSVSAVSTKQTSSDVPCQPDPSDRQADSHRSLVLRWRDHNQAPRARSKSTKEGHLFVMTPDLHTTLQSVPRASPGSHDTQATGFECLILTSSLPVSASNTLARLSRHPVASLSPWGIHATEATVSPCGSTNSSVPAASKIRAQRSWLPVASFFPSGRQATLRTSPL
mmetsp:Transcript_13363/g.36744  ORF Transcript_13363/g.36744 Transcript_13363/m.36744 type:complete len:176 (+) Transcript_13363:43-570(+)